MGSKRLFIGWVSEDLWVRPQYQKNTRGSWFPFGCSPIDRNNLWDKPYTSLASVINSGWSGERVQSNQIKCNRWTDLCPQILSQDSEFNQLSHDELSIGFQLRPTKYPGLPTGVLNQVNQFSFRNGTTSHGIFAFMQDLWFGRGFDLPTHRLLTKSDALVV